MNILALDIGGTAIKSGLFENGTLTVQKETPSNGKLGASALIDAISSLIQEAIVNHPIERIGISITGQVSPQDGSIIFATDSIPGFTGTPLKEILFKRHGIPLTVDNDVNCAALGEGFYGAATNYNNFLCITYGTGIGGAIVIDKKIFYGKIGIAGELGHMITHAGGDACVCGKNGCYEAYASTTALIKRVHSATSKLFTGRDIFNLMGNDRIKYEIDIWIDEIVYGLVSLTHIFNPQAIILGGGIMEQDYVYHQILERTKHSVIASFQGTDILHAKLGNSAGIYGAYKNAIGTLL